MDGMESNWKQMLLYGPKQAWEDAWNSFFESQGKVKEILNIIDSGLKVKHWFYVQAWIGVWAPPLDFQITNLKNIADIKKSPPVVAKRADEWVTSFEMLKPKNKIISN